MNLVVGVAVCNLTHNSGKGKNNLEKAEEMEIDHWYPG